jgi:peptidyl-prolyl cis-trans isomerase C
MIAAEAQHHPARTPAMAFQAAARALILRTLLLEEARRRGLDAAPELVAPGKRETQDEALMRQLMNDAVSIAEPSDSVCLAFYEAHIGRFHSPDLMEVSHILFAAHPQDAAARSKAKSNARAALAELMRKPDAFDAIARERSDCPSKSAGGRLGQLGPDDLIPEFAAAVSGLGEGKIGPDAVETRFGFHIVRLDAKERGKVLPFAYVREQIATFLAEQQWRRDSTSFLAGLVRNARIEGVEMMTGINEGLAP